MSSNDLAFESQTRLCSNCHKSYPVDEFLDAKGINGFKTCVQCRKKRNSRYAKRKLEVTLEEDSKKAKVSCKTFESDPSGLESWENGQEAWFEESIDPYLDQRSLLEIFADQTPDIRCGNNVHAIKRFTLPGNCKDNADNRREFAKQIRNCIMSRDGYMWAVDRSRASKCGILQSFMFKCRDKDAMNCNGFIEINFNHMDNYMELRYSHAAHPHPDGVRWVDPEVELFIKENISLQLREINRLIPKLPNKRAGICTAAQIRHLYYKYKSLSAPDIAKIQAMHAESMLKAVSVIKSPTYLGEVELIMEYTGASELALSAQPGKTRSFAFIPKLSSILVAL